MVEIHHAGRAVRPDFAGRADAGGSQGFRVQPGYMAMALVGSRPERELRDGERQISSLMRNSRSTGRLARTRSSPRSRMRSETIGVIAAIAASRAWRPEGLIATILRRASSQSGRICT